ncbi:hypothetical protein FBEOM_12909 [Fusarium beomiforme]|uniref:Uncharacterized protein n=1 Tax=Fusarium beomiforme TaxID=44412 RepID=A0A9P5DS22_9HYPO|nr:hypothetical protein FBEOM_12909 [Fusarium beomiforme]
MSAYPKLPQPFRDLGLNTLEELRAFTKLKFDKENKEHREKWDEIERKEREREAHGKSGGTWAVPACKAKKRSPAYAEPDTATKRSRTSQNEGDSVEEADHRYRSVTPTSNDDGPGDIDDLGKFIEKDYAYDDLASWIEPSNDERDEIRKEKKRKEKEK